MASCHALNYREREGPTEVFLSCHEGQMFKGRLCCHLSCPELQQDKGSSGDSIKPLTDVLLCPGHGNSRRQLQKAPGVRSGSNSDIIRPWEVLRFQNDHTKSSQTWKNWWPSRELTLDTRLVLSSFRTIRTPLKNVGVTIINIHSRLFRLGRGLPGWRMIKGQKAISHPWLWWILAACRTSIINGLTSFPRTCWWHCDSSTSEQSE